MIFGDTIAAIATARGRGGVAIVRISGPEALSVAARLTGGAVAEDAPRGMTVCRIRASAAFGAPIVDDGVALVFRAPQSYTGEDVVEFQGHGGEVSPRRVLAACLAAGARLARRGEFTERAFLNGKLDYDQAESVLDLVDAKTDRAADAALDGLAGRKARELKELYGQALELSAQLEHALDFNEGELPADFLAAVTADIAKLKSALALAARRAAEGRLLREGALVVLAGPPNAGKSSLLNALLEEHRAIVSATPGTTRDTIEEWMDLDGWPVRLVDTAGLRETADEIEAEGVRRAEALLARADVALWLGDDPASCPPAPFVLPLHAKCDLGRGPGLNVSARTGEGLEALKRAIGARLAEKAAAGGEGDAGGARAALLHEVLAMLEADGGGDLVLAANCVRMAAERLGAAIGATYSDDLLDNLFSRFCVGK